MAVAQKIGARHYLECSAKSGEGVREVFQYATRAALLSRYLLLDMVVRPVLIRFLVT